VITQGLTALVLAGMRQGGDALADHAGVSHKAMIDVNGQPMLHRVLRALSAVPAVARIVVAIERPEIVAAVPGWGTPVSFQPAQSGPSASVAYALQQEGTPLLVTTADHALLQPAWVQAFLAADRGNADALLALANRDTVQAAVPDTQRTWLRFADGQYSGCNLFLLRTAAASGVVALWQQLEAERKKPLSLIKRLGPAYALRYRLGWLRLDEALQRLGALAGASLDPVLLGDGRAAIDVDKVADLELVRRLARSTDVAG
jgi:GTP:adenosylcobinamide-phosphate guanylyltransferase